MEGKLNDVEKIKRFLNYFGFGFVTASSLAYLAYRRATKRNRTQDRVSIEERTDPVSEAIHNGIGDALAGTERGLDSASDEAVKLTDDNQSTLELAERLQERAERIEGIMENLKRGLEGEAD